MCVTSYFDRIVCFHAVYLVSVCVGREMTKGKALSKWNFAQTCMCLPSIVRSKFIIRGWGDFCKRWNSMEFILYVFILAVGRGQVLFSYSAHNTHVIYTIYILYVKFKKKSTKISLLLYYTMVIVYACV